MRIRAILLAGCCLGGVLVLMGTPFGPAVSLDSAVYIAAADNLVDGEGFRGYDGDLITQKPPGYSALLALGRMVGLEPMATARVMNVFVFGLIVLLAGWFFFSRLRTPHFAWVGFLAVLFSWPLLQVAMKVWSEPVFILLVILFIAYAPTVLTRPTWQRLILFAALAALASMQRYIGAALLIVGAGMILMMAERTSLRRRFQYAVGFGLLASAPLVLWAIRNYQIDATLTGGRPLSRQALIMESVSHLAGTFSTWIVPPVLPELIGIALGIGLTAIMILGLTTRTRSEHSRVRIMDLTVLLFVVTYTVIQFAASTIQVAAPLSNRMLSPLYVPLVYLLMVGFERATELGAGYFRNPEVLRRLAAAACAVWLLYPVLTTALYVSLRASYDTNVWNDSALARSLKANPPEGRIYSNQAWIVYLSTDRQVSPLPETDIDAFLTRELEEHGLPFHLAWFYDSDRAKTHVSRVLNEYLSDLTSLRDSAKAEGLTSDVLDFMRRSGVSSRAEPVLEARFDPSVDQLAASSDTHVVTLFEDGALYVFPDERPTNR